MTDNNKQLTHAELAKGLGVSRSYVSRLSRLGMPTDRIQSARAWIKKRSKSIGTDSGSQESLTEARRQKLKLECEGAAMNEIEGDWEAHRFGGTPFVYKASDEHREPSAEAISLCRGRHWLRAS